MLFLKYLSKYYRYSIGTCDEKNDAVKYGFESLWFMEWVNGFSYDWYMTIKV